MDHICLGIDTLRDQT